MIWNSSKCLNGYLHRYEIIKSNEEIAIERCEICKKRRIYRVKDGRIHNLLYSQDHIRQVLQPGQRLFSHEYPNFK